MKPTLQKQASGTTTARGRKPEAPCEALKPPAILAPAGGREAFLAAVAAGAEEIYCGLKRYSARRAAINFTLPELMPLVDLAHERGTRVFVTLNSLLKPAELDAVCRTMDQLNRQVRIDGLIVQDPAVIDLASQVGFRGEIHLSTLANVGFPAGLAVAAGLGVRRVVLPRELNVDEIKTMAASCPNGLALELFIHGALCYGVSGRCYWSSWLGGKSGLRGRCVQPCRRTYRLDKSSRTFFSCQDLSLDVLVKVLLGIPQIRSWKIEGRKKGPHYVYYTVEAYRMLRDEGRDPQAKKAALTLLQRALGRPGTHYNFLPQRPQQPIAPDHQTASGLPAGIVRGGDRKPYITPREALYAGDILRVGYEDAPGHQIVKVRKFVPRKGRLYIKPGTRSGGADRIPVFLVDRREPALQKLIADLQKRIENRLAAPVKPSSLKIRPPKPRHPKGPPIELTVHSGKAAKGGPRATEGIWLFASTGQAAIKAAGPQAWWWLPPVVWPAEQQRLQRLIDLLVRKFRSRHFVLNAAWQMALFSDLPGLHLWAGPFCNIANPLHLSVLKRLGFSGAIVSPELDGESILQLPAASPLPLGIVVSGNWPLCISRTLSTELRLETPFVSPKGELAWAVRRGEDYWLYPNWAMDLDGLKTSLRRAGYSLFARLVDPPPAGLQLKKRPGVWNWDTGLA